MRLPQGHLNKDLPTDGLLCEISGILSPPVVFGTRIMKSQDSPLLKLLVLDIINILTSTLELICIHLALICHD